MHCHNTGPAWPHLCSRRAPISCSCRCSCRAPISCSCRCNFRFGHRCEDRRDHCWCAFGRQPQAQKLLHSTHVGTQPGTGRSRQQPLKHHAQPLGLACIVHVTAIRFSGMEALWICLRGADRYGAQQCAKQRRGRRLKQPGSPHQAAALLHAEQRHRRVGAPRPHTSRQGARAAQQATHAAAPAVTAHAASTARNVHCNTACSVACKTAFNTARNTRCNVACKTACNTARNTACSVACKTAFNTAFNTACNTACNTAHNAARDTARTAACSIACNTSAVPTAGAGGRWCAPCICTLNVAKCGSRPQRLAHHRCGNTESPAGELWCGTPRRHTRVRIRSQHRTRVASATSLIKADLVATAIASTHIHQF
eukprot:366452-Chlamydomonas_euryale.AAC.2